MADPGRGKRALPLRAARTQANQRLAAVALAEAAPADSDDSGGMCSSETDSSVYDQGCQQQQEGLARPPRETRDAAGNVIVLIDDSSTSDRSSEGGASPPPKRPRAAAGAPAARRGSAASRSAAPPAAVAGATGRRTGDGQLVPAARTHSPQAPTGRRRLFRHAESSVRAAVGQPAPLPSATAAAAVQSGGAASDADEHAATQPQHQGGLAPAPPCAAAPPPHSSAAQAGLDGAAETPSDGEGEHGAAQGFAGGLVHPSGVWQIEGLIGRTYMHAYSVLTKQVLSPWTVNITLKPAFNGEKANAQGQVSKYVARAAHAEEADQAAALLKDVFGQAHAPLDAKWAQRRLDLQRLASLTEVVEQLRAWLKDDVARWSAQGEGDGEWAVFEHDGQQYTAGKWEHEEDREKAGLLARVVLQGDGAVSPHELASLDSNLVAFLRRLNHPAHILSALLADLARSLNSGIRRQKGSKRLGTGPGFSDVYHDDDNPGKHKVSFHGSSTCGTYGVELEAAIVASAVRAHQGAKPGHLEICPAAIPPELVDELVEARVSTLSEVSTFLRERRRVMTSKLGYAGIKRAGAGFAFSRTVGQDKRTWGTFTTPASAAAHRAIAQLYPQELEGQEVFTHWKYRDPALHEVIVAEVGWLKVEVPDLNALWGQVGARAAVLRKADNHQASAEAALQEAEQLRLAVQTRANELGLAEDKRPVLDLFEKVRAARQRLDAAQAAMRELYMADICNRTARTDKIAQLQTASIVLLRECQPALLRAA